MTEAKITLVGRPKDPKGSIHIRLPFEVPEELLSALCTKIKNAVEEWEDMVVLHQELN